MTVEELIADKRHVIQFVGDEMAEFWKLVDEHTPAHRDRILGQFRARGERIVRHRNLMDETNRLVIGRFWGGDWMLELQGDRERRHRISPAHHGSVIQLDPKLAAEMSASLKGLFSSASELAEQYKRGSMSDHGVDAFRYMNMMPSPKPSWFARMRRLIKAVLTKGE